jgi:hypothetical protein
MVLLQSLLNVTIFLFLFPPFPEASEKAGDRHPPATVSVSVSSSSQLVVGCLPAGCPESVKLAVIFQIKPIFQGLKASLTW